MKKLFHILVIVGIVIILVILSLPQDKDTVVNEQGESVATGIINDQESVNSPPRQASSETGDQNKGNSEPGSESDLKPEEILNQVQDDSEVEVGIKIGNKAPNFRLKTFNGEVVELASIDKPVVIDFWAGWCPFCVEELPDLEEAHQEFPEVEFLGIHRSETESIERGQEFADDKGVTYDLLKDTTGAVYDVYSGGQPFMPVAYFIDSDGVIQERVLGPKSGDKIRSSVNKLLE